MRSFELTLTCLLGTHLVTALPIPDDNPPQCVKFPTDNIVSEKWSTENEKSCWYKICGSDAPNTRPGPTSVSANWKFGGEEGKDSFCLVQGSNNNAEFNTKGIQGACSELPQGNIQKDVNGGYWSKVNEKSCRILECPSNIAMGTNGVQTHNNLLYYYLPTDKYWCLLKGQDIAKSAVNRCTDDPPAMKIVYYGQDWYKLDLSCRIYYCDASVKADGNSKKTQDKEGKDHHFANVGGEWCMIINTDTSQVGSSASTQAISINGPCLVNSGKITKYEEAKQGEIYAHVDVNGASGVCRLDHCPFSVSWINHQVDKIYDFRWGNNEKHIAQVDGKICMVRVMPRDGPFESCSSKFDNLKTYYQANGGTMVGVVESRESVCRLDYCAYDVKEDRSMKELSHDEDSSKKKRFLFKSESGDWCMIRDKTPTCPSGDCYKM